MKIFSIFVTWFIVCKFGINAFADSCFVQVRAFDLTEDMSVVSTKNDEILILVYSDVDSIYKFQYAKDFVFKEGQMTMGFYLITNRNEDIIMYLIELDSDKSIEQIVPVINEYHVDILKLYSEANKTALEKYLGDDDLLFIGSAETKKNGSCKSKFSISGFQRADSYHYEIKFN